MGSNQIDFVEALVDHEMFKVDVDEGFGLSSTRQHPETGDEVEITSPYYFDLSGVGFYRDTRQPLLEWLDSTVDTRRVAGVNTGGNTIASLLTGYSDQERAAIPARKPDDGDYTGLESLGMPPQETLQDERVSAVDDVGTTGTTVAYLHEKLDEAGAEVASWNLAVDRQEGLRGKADEYDAELNAFVDAAEALEVLHQREFIDSEQYGSAQNYIEDPVEWNMEKGFI